VDMPLRLSNAVRCSHTHSHRTEQFVYLLHFRNGLNRLRSKIGSVGVCREVDVDLLAGTFRPEELDRSNVAVCPDQRMEVVEQLDDGERLLWGRVGRDLEGDGEAAGGRGWRRLAHRLPPFRCRARCSERSRASLRR